MLCSFLIVGILRDRADRVVEGGRGGVVPASPSSQRSLNEAGKLRHKRINSLPQNFQDIYQPPMELLLLLYYPITTHLFPINVLQGILTLSLPRHLTQI